MKCRPFSFPTIKLPHLLRKACCWIHMWESQAMHAHQRFGCSITRQRTRAPSNVLVFPCMEPKQALFLTWKVARHICAKRPAPFLPTLVDFLERARHLQLKKGSGFSLSEKILSRIIVTQCASQARSYVMQDTGGQFSRRKNRAQRKVIASFVPVGFRCRWVAL